MVIISPRSGSGQRGTPSIHGRTLWLFFMGGPDPNYLRPSWGPILQEPNPTKSLVKEHTNAFCHTKTATGKNPHYRQVLDDLGPGVLGAVMTCIQLTKNTFTVIGTLQYLIGWYFTMRQTKTSQMVLGWQSTGQVKI